MTAEQQKAKELIDKFRPFFDNQISKSSEHAYIKSIKIYNDNVKQCAILCVDEIINSSPTNPLKGGYIELYSDMIDEAIAFYQTVKQEIINYK